jgi:hypothetical protein
LCTIWRWVLHGARGRRLRSIHVGGRRFILVKDLEDFLSPPEPCGTNTPSSTDSTRELQRRAQVADRELDRLGIGPRRR